MDPKTLQKVAQEKVPNQKVPTPPTAQPTPPMIPFVPPTDLGEFDRLSQLPENHIQNVIKSLKDKQKRETVWFEFQLPSNGKCGYPSNIKLREMTTEDEKILIKEMFSSKENSILNVIRKCAKFEGLAAFDFENLTTFDQDFILVELSAITFPGEKDINVTDENNHKLSMKLNKEDLVLTSVPFDLEYPFKVVLPTSGITWFLKFTTLKTLKEIDKATKSLSADVLTRLLVSISLATEKVEVGGKAVLFDNFLEVIKLLENLLPSDLKVVIDFYNEKTSTAYGYKLNKEYYCSECGKGGQMELEPLNFFRITI
jgi:hypothetical protein